MYKIAGASRGIGLQFVIDLLARGETVIALARDPHNSKGLQEIKNNPQLLILKADITDAATLNIAAEETSKFTGGRLDVLINNAMYQNKDLLYHTLFDFPSPDILTEDLTTSFSTHVVGPVLTTNAFLPLLRKGQLKKVISLTTGLAIPEMALASSMPKLTSYTITKCALEMVNVKYAVALKEEGFIFLAISPGVVNTATAPPTEAQMKEIAKLMTAFKSKYPTGRVRPSLLKASR